jgi:hypothetical protein
MQYKEDGCDHDDSQAASCFAHVALNKPPQHRGTMFLLSFRPLRR